MKRTPILSCALLLTVVVCCGAAEPRPLVNLHAHNDYLHPRPLLDALDHGFCSVEADIHLVNGQLLVAHDAKKVQPGRTLQALYLGPLLQRVHQNGGRVYAGGPEFTLLIDLKGDWRKLYPVLRSTLRQYAGMLTTFQGEAKTPGAVTIIITGNRSLEMFAGESVRYACLDGDLSDLDSGASPNLIPWISANWEISFEWRGHGSIPDADLVKLKTIVTKTHEHGRRLRFWGAPDNARTWKMLREEGVDLINTDYLTGAEKFFLEQ